MATKLDVEAAAKVPAASQKIQDIRARHVALTLEEEVRQEKWTREYYALQGEVRAAEQELQAAAEAEARIVREVPMELRQAQGAAEVAVRGCGEAVTRARMEAMAAEDNYKRRIEGMRKPGAEALTKAQIEQFLDEVALKKGALKEEEVRRKDLELRASKAKAAVDTEVARLKRSAK